MKRKLLILPLLLAVLMTFSGITAFAETTVHLKHANTYREMTPSISINSAEHEKDKRAYFGDEAEIFRDKETRSDIFKTIHSQAKSSDINITVFIGGYIRNEDKINELLKESQDLIFSSSDKPYAALYLDFDGNGNDIDKIYVNGGFSFEKEEEDNALSYIKKQFETRKEVSIEDVEGAIDYFLSCIETHKSEKTKSNDPDIADLPHKGEFKNMTVDTALKSSPHYQSEKAYFCDEAEIFDEQTRKEIFKKTEEVSEKINMGVAIYIGGYNRSRKETREFIGVALEKLFGTDDGDDSIGLYLDFEGGAPGTAYDYIDAYRDAYFWYPELGEDNSSESNRTERMLDHIYKYLPKTGSDVHKSDVKKAVDSFLHDLEYYKNQGIINDLHYRVAESKMYRYTMFGNIYESPIYYNFFFVFLVISLIIGLIAFFAFGSHVRKKYKFRESYSASGYTSKNRIHIHESRDIFVREYTTKTKIESSSGSHGGGGGGGHSSSHHGGGRSR